MAHTIILNHISKGFTDAAGQRRDVIRDVSLTIESGAFGLLLGRSGSGKSTLLNLVAGLYLPDNGSITVGDTEVSALGEARRDAWRSAGVGYVFQTFNLLSPLTVLENIYVPGILAGQGRQSDRTEAMEILKRLDLADHAHKRPFELSVGQRQRVAVGRALLKQPAVLLADEPTANLDAESAAVVREAFLHLNSLGSTVLVATHDLVFRDIPHTLTFDVSAGKEVSP